MPGSEAYWIWLAECLGSGAVNSATVLELFSGGAQEIAENRENLQLLELLTPLQRQRIGALSPQDYAPLQQQLAAGQVRVLPYDSADYPDLLRKTASPPPVLYLRGHAALLNAPLMLGMVGTRRPSAYGVEAAKMLGKELAATGAVLVSGLAAGLDAEAHKAALAVEGGTVACLAFGFGECYPAANRKLLEVIERHGAVISEYPPGTRAEKAYFLQRNRIIAGISHGVLVTESRVKSGTLSTVNFAAEWGRDVFAVPGSILSPLSEGTNALLREGAYVATSAQDVFSVYNMESAQQPVITKAPAEPAERAQPSKNALKKTPGQPPLPPLDPKASAAQGVQLSAHFTETETESLTAQAQVLLRCLAAQPQSLDALCAASGLTAAQAMAALTELEIGGFSRQLAGRKFVIMQ